MRRLALPIVFAAGLVAGYLARPEPAAAGDAHEDRTVRAVERIADRMTELVRATDKRDDVKVACACDCKR